MARSKAKVVSNNDIGNTLKIDADNKLQAKLGPGLTSGSDGSIQPNVDGTSIKVNAQGVLEAIQQVDVKLSSLAQVPNTKTLRATLSDGSTAVDIDLTPFFPEGVKPTAIGMNAEDKLEITLSDGTKVTSEEAFYHTEITTLGDVPLGKTSK